MSPSGPSDLGAVVLRLFATPALALANGGAEQWLNAIALTFQVTVAAYALWLNRVFGTRRAGWALCGAFLLMMLMHLNEAVSPPVTVATLGLSPPLAYLFISLLLLLGLNHVATLYRERQRTEIEIRTARDELDYRVRERTAELAEEVEQRKQAEAEIRASQRLYRGLVDSLDGIIFECEADDLTFTFVSPQVERLLGYMPDEWLKGLTWADILHPEDYAAFSQCCASASQGQSSATLEFRIVAKDGTKRWARVVANAVTTPQGQRTIRGVLLDVTERKILEDELRQAQKMEAVGRLAGGVAHDFNNLLTAIDGYAALLLEFSDPQAQTKIATEISEAVRRGGQLTRQLLTFSRKQELRFELTDLNKLVENTASMIGVLLGQEIQLHTRLAEHLPLVKADTGQLTQVLMNLGVNARDAMPSGGSFILQTETALFDTAGSAQPSQTRTGLCVCLSVSDTGSGISPEVVPHIFEPFFTTKGAGKGTGLGLSIVYGIVKQHGGWIQLDTAPGQGTTFRLFFPASSAPAPALLVPAENRQNRRNQSSVRVDDDGPLVLANQI